MIFILQILIYLILFMAAIKAVAGNNPQAQNHIFHCSFNRRTGTAGNIYRCMEWHYRLSDCLCPGAAFS